MAGTVGDAIVGVRGAVVKKLSYFRVGGGGGCSLFGANFTECMEELVVDVGGIVEEGSYDALDALDVGFIKGWASVWVTSVLGGGTIGDGSGCVG